MDASFFERPTLNAPYAEGAGISTAAQQYDPTPIINELRRHVDRWRASGNPSHWGG